MTDRVKGCYVAFDQDYRVDDVEVILKAIRMIKGVAEVSAEDMVRTPDDWMARQHVRQQLADKMWKAYKDISGV